MEKKKTPSFYDFFFFFTPLVAQNAFYYRSVFILLLRAEWMGKPASLIVSFFSSKKARSGSELVRANMKRLKKVFYLPDLNG